MIDEPKPRRPRSRWTEVVAAMLGAVLAACVAAVVIAATVRLVTWTLGL